MAFTPKQHREHRIKLKAMGICTLCHKEKTERGKSVCAKCIKRVNEKRDEYRKDRTRCRDCLNKLDEYVIAQGRVFCQYCAEHRAITQRRLNEAKRS